jgi:hypothetical protein
MTGNSRSCALSISLRICPMAVQDSAPQEFRQRLIESRMSSLGSSPVKA